MKTNPLTICILAAGKGNRMKSDTPKVLHTIGGTPMIHSVIETAKKFNPEKIIVIVGYKKELVKESLKNYNVEFAIQNKQFGTAHAVKQCESQLNGFNGDVLVLSGDVPFISYSTLKSLINLHNKQNSKASLLSTFFDDPSGYGRIIRDANNNFIKIVEHKDANSKERTVKEINSGTYMFNSRTLFKKINFIKNKNSQNEYYLTDIFGHVDKMDISIISTNNNKEISGVNTLEQLKELDK